MASIIETGATDQGTGAKVVYSSDDPRVGIKDFYNPASGRAPYIGEKVLYKSGESVQAVPWAGNVPQGLSTISYTDALNLINGLPRYGAPIMGRGGDNTTIVTGYTNYGYKDADIQKMLEPLVSKTGAFDPTIQPKYFMFNPTAPDLDKSNFSDAFKQSVSGALAGMVQIKPGEYVPKGSAGDPASSAHLTNPPVVVPPVVTPLATAGTGELLGKTIPAAAAPVSTATAPNVSLKPGDTGDDVKKLQDYLVSQGFMTQEQVNTGYGTYGPQTTAAVAALQKQQGVDNSTGVGYYGPKTQAAIGTSTAATTTAPATTVTTTDTAATVPSTQLKPGDTGEKVKELQDFLVENGYMTQAQVDTGYGTYGPKTTAAVAQLQVDHGVDTSAGGNGTFGPNTIQAVTTAKPQTSNTHDIDLQKVLANPNLTSDQRTAIQSIYDAVTTNDTATADRLKAAFDAASKYSDPYFKAQISLATDALARGLSAKEGDLSYQEKSLASALSKLRADTSASEGQLSFQHQKELQDLAKKYEIDLGDTRDALASTGFTASSKRARAEDILRTNNEGLVESSNKTYGYQIGNADRNLASSEADTAAQVENLKRLTAAGKLDLLRTAEGQVGTQNLADLGYTNMLGGVGGSIPRAQVKDALDFSSSFVF